MRWKRDSRRWRLRNRFRRAVMAGVLVGLLAGPAAAAALDGVQLPETVEAGGKLLHLNGFGLRTWSILRLHIYVVALYLEHPSADPGAILTSPGTKLLTVSFLRNVSAAQARASWREGLENNCQAPCALNPAEVATFLAHVPAMRAGERFSLLFTDHGAVVNASGQRLGVVSEPELAEAMLATFLGPKPGSHRLKRELLSESAAETGR